MADQQTDQSKERKSLGVVFPKSKLPCIKAPSIVKDLEKTLAFRKVVQLKKTNIIKKTSLIILFFLCSCFNGPIIKSY